MHAHGADAPRLARRPLAWGALGTALLAFGFVAGILSLALIAGLRGGDEVRNTQTALLLYARIVLPKVLLPHALLTFAAYGLVERARALDPLGVWARRAVFVGIALALAAVLTAYWLPSDAFDLPRIKTRGPANFVATAGEIAAATTAAALIARWLLDRRGRRRAD